MNPNTQYHVRAYASNTYGTAYGNDVLFTTLQNRHVVDSYFKSPHSVHSVDIDGDGDFDILGAAYEADDITWWENMDGTGTSWTEHTVDGSFDGAISVYSADIDGDGDLDILGAGYLSREITWWENMDGTGISWTEHTVDAYCYGANSVYAGDIDGDGDLDIVGAARSSDSISWYENINGTGTSWNERTVDRDFRRPASVYLADIDGDGYLDVLAHGNEPAWWKNMDGTGRTWTQYTLENIYGNTPNSVYPADIDGDEDIDILVSDASQISWRENTDGTGTFWKIHTISEKSDWLSSAYSTDMDGDGDLDILWTGYSKDEISWWENIDDIGITWTKHTVSESFDGAYSGHAADINGDGYLDILAAASGANDIIWWSWTMPLITLTIPETATKSDGVLKDQGYIAIDTSLSYDLLLTLTSSAPTKVTVPSSVIIPAGSTSATFDLTIVAENALDYPETILITGSGTKFITGSDTITIDSISTCNITINTMGDGIGTLSENTQSVPYGSNLTITALPDASSVFSGWSGDVSGTGSAVLENITSDKTITATFNLKIYDITVTSTPGGHTDKDGSNSVKHGQSFSITATPEAGYRFSTWSGDVSSTINPLKITQVSADKNITANFETLQQAPVIGQGETIGVTMDEDSIPVAFALTLNASDVNGDTLTWRIKPDALPGHGTANVTGTGTSKAITYIPDHNWNGMDTFKVQVSDSGGLTDAITVTVTVTPVNDPPVSVNDTYTLDQDTVMNIPAPGVLSNDTDPDNTTVTAIKITDPTHGTVTLDVNGSFIYTPTPGYNGPDSFTYKSNDGTDDSPVATVHLAVNEIQQTAILPMISAGGYHTSVVKDDGTVWTWGENADGQLGNGTTTDQNTPGSVPGLSSVISIATGEFHTVALKNDGTVWTWGNNSTDTDQKIPTAVPGLSNIIAIAAGDEHTIALKNDGTVWTWGNNFHGQLGVGSVTYKQNIPVCVPGLFNVTAIASGDYHGIALKNDGTVWTWGSNYFGQLGDGTDTDHDIPICVPNLSNVTLIAAGCFHTLVKKEDGSVWAWGDNSWGQLGDGTNTDQNIPVCVAELSNVTAITAGRSHTIALKDDGTVWAWGYNEYGQLGDGTHTNQNIPGSVPGLSNVTAIDAGDDYTIVSKEDGSVWTWGSNYHGELGNGKNIYQKVPIPVSGLSSVTVIAAGYSHSIALRNDASVWTWGSNDDGELGDGTNTGQNIPGLISEFSNVTAIAAGNSHTIALKDNGTVWAWGSLSQLGDETRTSDSQRIPGFVPGLSNITDITAGGYHSICLKNDGSVWAWGSNRYGQLGDRTNTYSRNIPASVPGLTNIIAIAAGSSHSIALKKDGTVWAWGRNKSGQLGNGTTSDQNIPGSIPGLSSVIAIAAGDSHSIAIKEDGSVWTWGENNYGQLGNGTTSDQNIPGCVPELSNVIAIASGYAHTIALKKDGTVWSWGRNYSAELGDGTTTLRKFPSYVSGISNVTAIAAGCNHSFALTNDGTTWTWGASDFGQLGNGASVVNSDPIHVFSLSTPTLPLTGNLSVTITPIEIANSNTNWRVDGGEWQTSGTRLLGLSTGVHTMEFQAVPDWKAPEIETVTINKSQTTTITGSYINQSDLIIKGDFNRDGGVNLKDVILALKATTSCTDCADPQADVDGDGKIGLQDVIYVLQQSYFSDK